MKREVFVDTSGFFALLVKKDDCHEKARKILRNAGKQGTPFVTTDYVLDETATLLMARGHGHLAQGFFDSIFQSNACQLVWTGAANFHTTTTAFLKYYERGWSFTDCLSFQVMNERKLQKALTKDQHFQQAGFQALLLN